MPQTNYLTLYRASYPLLAPVQKPGGVTVLTTTTGGDVPNKPTFTTGTIQIVGIGVESEAQSVVEESVEETTEAEEEAELPHPRRGKKPR